jgi:hypothetical protein
VFKRLYLDLQTLAAGERNDGLLLSSANDELELRDLSLPAPSISSSKDKSDRDGFKHERVTRFIFSLSFSESCLLLLLFVCEWTDVLDVP